jgi:hypothetical protein
MKIWRFLLALLAIAAIACAAAYFLMRYAPDFKFLCPLKRQDKQCPEPFIQEHV